MKKLLILLMTAGAARGQNIFPDWPKIWSSYNTRPKDCHQAVIDTSGRKILVGVETIGDPRTMSARQAITLLVNEHGFWSEPIAISATGIVYFPTLAVDANGRVWIAWSQFENSVWTVMVRAWDHGKLDAAVDLGRGSRINLLPALAVLSSGEVFAAWQAEVKGRFAIRGSTLRGGRWSESETISAGGEQEFRPAVTVDSNGKLWLTWDRWTNRRYNTIARWLDGGKWSVEVDVSGGEEARAPQILADHSGRVWILASGKLVGVDVVGQRYATPGLTTGWKKGPDFFTIDGHDRFWFFQSHGQRILFDWQTTPTPAVTAIAVLDASGMHALPVSQAAMGYAAPLVDADGNVWVMNAVQFLRYSRPYPQAGGGAVVHPEGPGLWHSKESLTTAWPHTAMKVNGHEYQIYWADMHDHLSEQPRDLYIREWVDQFYLSARYQFGLDAVALTDHDWPGTTRSMYYAEQAIAAVLNTEKRFLAISGYEWSGDSQVRARFGDRTVLFPPGYHDPPRISDPVADTTDKLSRYVKEMGALDWPHHIGRAESPVNPRYLRPETEPVMEMTSGHGVFETYDTQHAVPAPFHTQIIPGTAVQDALALGKRVGMVGSSDSHSGFSGYRVGMLAIVAPELTHEAILDAIRRRHVYAVRGGEPIVVDFRVDGHFMGESFVSARPPRIEGRIKGSAAITRVELVRNNRYIFARDFSDGAREQAIEYQDEEAPPAYYYLRVAQGTNEWAWTSPVWVDREGRK
jgi:hypothetical protein